MFGIEAGPEYQNEISQFKVTNEQLSELAKLVKAYQSTEKERIRLFLRGPDKLSHKRRKERVLVDSEAKKNATWVVRNLIMRELCGEFSRVLKVSFSDIEVTRLCSADNVTYDTILESVISYLEVRMKNN